MLSSLSKYLFNYYNYNIYFDKFSAERKEKNPNATHITFTHIITKAMALGAWKCKSEFGRISFGFFKPAKKIGITILCD